MEVVITAEVGPLVAGAIEDLLARKPNGVLGLATGSSPLPVYAELARRSVDLAQTKSFLLDEYVGLPADHPQLYRSFIAEHFPGDGVIRGPDGMASDIEAECVAYEAAIVAAGGIDLQLLGIGTDGHIGFNEPTSSLASRTRLKTLTHQTRADNARFFGSLDDVPHHVITQGIGTILEARHLVLIATGWTKAEAAARAVEGPVTAMCPASALQLHPHATVIVDEGAASHLKLASYYRETYAAKPDWQGI